MLRFLLLSAICCTSQISAFGSIAMGLNSTGQLTATQCPGGICPLNNCPIANSQIANAGRQPGKIARELQAVVRISNRHGATAALGSGTLVDKNREHGLVLTCAHLFDDGIGTIVVVFAGGQAYGAKLLEIDRAWDLAALLIYAPTAEPLPVAEAMPQLGTPLQSCGFGSDGRLWSNRGRLLQAVTAQGTSTPESFELSGNARQGDSGGPVLDSQYRLVGVLFGTTGQVVAATGCGPVRRLLAKISSRFRSAGQTGETDPPATSPQSQPATPAAESNTGQSLKQIEARLQTAHERWQQITTELTQQREAIDRWHARSQHIETRLAELAGLLSHDALASTIREVVGHGTDLSNRSCGAGLWATIWPLLAGALGLSTPPTAAFVIWKLAKLALRGARLKSQSKTRPSPNVTSKNSSVLNDDYARQLVEVFQHSGRSPVQDATLGREYDEELRRAESSSDGALARFAKSLRDRVETRFHRIHGLRPTPAEPIEPAQNG